MMKYAIFLCLAVYCYAQEPKPCASPQQWEGRIFNSDREKGVFAKGKISYDESNMRFRIIDELGNKTEQEYFDTLVLHNVGMEYKLNLKTKQCTVSPLNRPFRPFGVPPFAKFVYEATLGAAAIPGEHMVVQVWGGEFENKDKFETTVTYPDCVPVHQFADSQERGILVSDFYDVNLGISDPMVFIPPPECNKL